ncbi:MAG: 3-oxoacyl-ACP reductase FabG [Clostridiales bacterium]|nr:3-oxoacyl-ACP reductase FabG [Clostridiales bacterium]
MKTAVVTGGTRGIGREISTMLINNGYRVFGLFAENFETAREFYQQINSESLTICQCDVSDINQIKKVFGEIGSVDLLVNNAGIACIDLFTSISNQKLEELISVNLTGAMHCSRAVLPNMINNQFGNIINISSMWGEVGASCEVVYSATKAGLIGFTKALAKEVGLSGIRVNCVSAGVIMTDMNSSLSKENLNSLIEDTPLAKTGTSKNIADAVEFLISDKAEFITGEVLRVNGGMVI